MKLKDVLRSPEAYVDYWAKDKRELTINDLDSLLLDYDRQLDEFNYEVAIHAAETRSKPVYLKAKTVKLMECAFANYLRNQPIVRRKELSLIINGKKENLNPLKTWVQAITGKLEDSDVQIMAHWLWLVKRNSLKLPVVYHIMPILISKQGSGKSTAIRNLMQPLQELTLELTVQQVVDERSLTLFSNYLIGILDEMAGAEKVEIADFKRNVTSGTLTYRPMRTNNQVKLTNLCSFIGASNNQIYEIIKDTTGIRRFFPIMTSPLMDREVINTINYLELWQGIDETKERGYYENVQAKVIEIQESLADKDDIIMFMENYGIIPGEFDDVELVSGETIYQQYVFENKNNGDFYRKSKTWFFKKMRAAGIKEVVKRDAKKVLRSYFAIRRESKQSLGISYDN